MNKYGKMSIKNMINFANPRSFVASLLPAIFTVVLCKRLGYSFDIVKTLALVICPILLQSSVNTLNDHADFIRGVDSIDDNLEETDNLMFYNNIDPKNVEKLGLIYLVLGIGFGLLSIKDFNKYTLIIATCGIVVVLLYSKGPLPLSYLPLGEIVSGLTMGLLIPLGMYSVITGQIEKKVIVYSLPFVIGISMIMMTNNGSDIEKDARAGRNTLAVIMGRENFARLYRTFSHIWLIVTIILIYHFSGIAFTTVAIVIFIFNKNPIIAILQAALFPKDRIKMIKNIAKANLIINAVYIFSITF